MTKTKNHEKNISDLNRNLIRIIGVCTKYSMLVTDILLLDLLLLIPKIIYNFDPMNLIDEHIDELKRTCKKYHVAELYVFGSILTDRFSKDSDLDFLVSFSGVDPLEYFDNYMDLKETLERLFSRKVDVVEVQTVKNPILKRSIDRDKVLLYGREDSKMAI